MNRVVRALEQTLFAILREFQRQIFVRAFRQIFQHAGGNDRRGGDVILHLHFHGRMEILAQAERAPRAVVVEADAQISRDELAVVALQFVAGRAVDDVHAEMFAPVAVPLRLVIAFDDEDEFLDVLRHAGQPGVVFRRVIVLVRREQLDDRAERAFRRQHGAIVRARLVREAVGVIAVDQFGHAVKILFQIRDEHRAGENRRR